MPTLITPVQCEPLYATSRQARLTSAIDDLLSVASAFDVDHRQSKRQPFTRPVQLFPCDPTGNTRQSPILCMGKEISDTGFGFLHQQPMPFRFLVLSFAPSVDCPLEILMRLKRCRFLGENWYESGAQFLRVIDAGSDQAVYGD